MRLDLKHIAVYNRGEYSEYTPAQVFEGLMFLGDETFDPDPDRRADLEAALLAITPPQAAACVLYAQGYNGAEIAKKLKRHRSNGYRLLSRGLKALVATMNGEVTRHAKTRLARPAQKRQVHAGACA